MRPETGDVVPRNTIRNDSGALLRLAEDAPDGLAWWMEQYFRFEVSTSPASQKVLPRDLGLFLVFCRLKKARISVSR